MPAVPDTFVVGRSPVPVACVILAVSPRANRRQIEPSLVATCDQDLGQETPDFVHPSATAEDRPTVPEGLRDPEERVHDGLS